MKHSSPRTTPSSIAGPSAQLAAAADDAAAQADSRPEVGVVVHDRPLQIGVGAHPHVAAEHCVLAQRRAAFYAAVVANYGWSLDLRPRVDIGAFSQPNAVAQGEARQLGLDPAVQDVLVGPGIGLQRADILPVALGHIAIEQMAFGRQPRENIGREVDLARTYEVKDLGLENIYPGIYGVREDLSPRRFLKEPFDRPVFSGDDDPELQRVRHRAAAPS